MKKEAPLASRLRPGNLDEVVGQQHIMGEANCSTGQSRRTSWAPSFFTGRPARERPPWPR